MQTVESCFRDPERKRLKLDSAAHAIEAGDQSEATAATEGPSDARSFFYVMKKHPSQWKQVSVSLGARRKMKADHLRVAVATAALRDGREDAAVTFDVLDGVSGGGHGQAAREITDIWDDSSEFEQQ